MADPDDAGTGTARPRRARSDAARNAGRLITAARELFDARGPDVALDDVAKHAGVGNATLYRHFPTRSDLLAAVYADEVAELCDQGAALLRAPAPAAALFGWLDAFVEHVADKRPLAMAATHGRPERRTELFDRWHDSLRATALPLLARAQADGTVRGDLTAEDLLALAAGLCLAGGGAEQGRHLLRLARQGLQQPEPPVTTA